MSPLISGLASVASLIFNATSGSSAPSAASRRGSGSDASEAQPSSVLMLSPQAEALAGFAGKGVLVSQDAASGALSATQRVAGSGGGGSGRRAAGGSVSTQDFKELLTQFGADDVQKDQITAGFDANQDGRISHAEFLKGLSDTSIHKPGSALSQAVMQVMDQGGNADGVVSQAEFAALTTAFAKAEWRMGTA